MELYLVAILAIVLLNAFPAFAPPTWMALVYFLLHHALNPVALVILGVLSATTGRAILAWYFRKFAHLIPTKFSKNMEYAGQYFTDHSAKRFALLGIFLVSPVSSAQLFEAAGLMKGVKLKPLLGAFALGRTISYSIYVSTAAAIATTSFGEMLVRELKSPKAIAIQILMIAGLIALGSIDWQSKVTRLKNHSKARD